jgi:sulfur relay (sulfurtransferase) complex TusBCD TusD component (DsrE family)
MNDMRYLLLASRDPFTARDAEGFHALAERLAGRGHPVTLYLVQNGVLAARRGAAVAQLARLARAGVAVLADEFSLSERGIAVDGLADGIAPATLERVIDALADGARALWH